MPDLNTWQIVLAVALSSVTLAGLVAKRFGPKYRHAKTSVVAGWAQLFGTEEVRHKVTGKVLVPAQPGVGVQVAELSVAVTKLVELHATTAAHDQRLSAVEADVDTLKSAALERIASKVDSIRGWEAIQAAVMATPDPATPPADPEP